MITSSNATESPITNNLSEVSIDPIFDVNKKFRKIVVS